MHIFFNKKYFTKNLFIFLFYVLYCSYFILFIHTTIQSDTLQIECIEFTLIFLVIKWYTNRAHKALNALQLILNFLLYDDLEALLVPRSTASMHFTVLLFPANPKLSDRCA